MKERYDKKNKETKENHNRLPEGSDRKEQKGLEPVVVEEAAKAYNIVAEPCEAKGCCDGGDPWLRSRMGDELKYILDEE